MVKRIIIFMCLLMTSGLYANFQVAPQVQRMNLKRPGTQKIYLKNSTNKLKKIKIYSERPKNQKTKNLYMGDWIIVYPKIVYLKPNSKKVVRMAARPPKDLADGEYRSHIVFEEIPVKKYDNSEKGEDKVGVNLEIIHILVSTVYGYSGKLEYGGIFDDFQVVTDNKQTYLTSKVINTGTTALDLLYKVTYSENMKELKTEDLLMGKVMRENYRDSVIELKKIPKNANRMKVEYYYRIKKEAKKVKEGEDEYDKFKIGEKKISIEKITKDKYFKELEKKNKEGNKVEDKKES